MAVKQNESKTWDVRVSYKEGDKYKTKSKYGLRTKKEAIIWEGKLKDIIKSKSTFDRNISFADYFKKWVEVYKANKVAPTTLANYYGTHSKIVSFFGNKPLTKINKIDYQYFLNEYGQYLAEGTMTKTNKHIRACIQDALHDGYLKKDFTYKIEVTGTAGKSDDSKYLSQADTKRLIQALNDEDDGLSLSRRMALLALATGMRFAEIQGLTFDRLNFDDNTIKIDRAWDNKEKKFKPTKNKETRVIKIEDEVMQNLRQFTIDQKKKQLSSYMSNPHKLVFAKYDGLPATNDAANDSLTNACKRAGIKRITFHSLRHTHASILIYNGMDLSSIAKRLGHKSAITTANVYAHIIEEMQNKADKLSDSAMKELFS